MQSTTSSAGPPSSSSLADAANKDGSTNSNRAAGASSTLVVTRHCPVEMRRNNWSIDQFVVAKKLGGGYASTVHLAICKATGTQVAIKVYHRCKLSQLNNYQVHREIRIHSCLDHKNVLQLYAAFEDDVGVYLVTEYASRGDVFGELDRRGGSMTEADAVRQVLSPFLSALEYLHMLNIIHRDIKPENLLFTATGVLKVADFGLSIDITQERPVTRVGTLDYMAPEVVICPDKVHPSDHKEKTHLHYTYLVDAWAVGVLAYELTVGRAPFDAGHKRGTIDNILHAQPRFPGWISDSCRHFVSWSLTKDVVKRPGIQQLAEHPWIHQYAAPAARPKTINPGRAASCYNLSMQQPAGAGAPQQLQQEAGNNHHQPRHKLGTSEAELASGLVQLQEADEEEEELFVSAHGELPAAAKATAATTNGSGSKSQPPVPGVAVAITATSGSAAAGAAPASPFAGGASQQAPPAASSPSNSVLGAAADKLRAFVHRCQSANDIDGLKAFMLNQPAEPSNACFEPGGRFYTGPPTAQQQAAAAAKQQEQQQQQQVVVGSSAHDSATSVGSPGSSSSSRAQDNLQQGAQQQQQFSNVLKPLAAPAAAGCFGSMVGGASKPLQLIRLPQQGRADSSKGTASPVDGSKGSPATAGTHCSTDMELTMSHASGLPAGSPMAVSPAALIRTTSAGTNADQAQRQQRPFSRASSESCSSSCADNGPRDNSSICSSHSWGYGQASGDMDHSPTQQQAAQFHQAAQQQQQATGQMLPPRPHTPPRLGGGGKGCMQQQGPSGISNSSSSPYHGSKLSVMSGPSANAAAAAAAVQQLSASTGMTLEAAALAAGANCADLEQLMFACKSGTGNMSQAAGAALAASKHALVSLSADCRGAAGAAGAAGGVVSPEQLQQEQQAAAMTINSCFGFLKTTARR